MLKQRQRGLETLHGAILIVTITTAFIGWVVLVESMGWIRFSGDFRSDFYFLGVLGAMMWVHHNLHGVASRLGALGRLEIIRLTSQQLTRIMVVLFAIAFLTKDISVSRAFLLGFVALSAALLWAGNTWLPSLLVRIFFQSQRLRTVIVSSGLEAVRLRRWLARRAHLGIETLGYVAPAPEPSVTELPWLGTMADLNATLIAHGADQVVIAQGEHTAVEREGITRVAEHLGCRVRFYLSLRSLFGEAVAEIEQDDGYAFAVGTSEPLDNPYNRLIKRMLDIGVALPMVLLVMPPLTLWVWWMQRRQSPGPVFYRQLRSGINRRRFYIYKFRTMHVSAPQLEARQATQNDTRVYSFGRFMRRTSLDEVPQFINVLLGEMSVSGPRPHLLEHDEQFAQIVNAYYQRHFVKPGITGLAQSKGFRGEVLEPGLLMNRLKYDMLYVSNWSLLLDVSILASTARQVLFPPRTAY